MYQTKEGSAEKSKQNDEDERMMEEGKKYLKAGPKQEQRIAGTRRDEKEYSNHQRYTVWTRC